MRMDKDRRDDPLQLGKRPVPKMTREALVAKRARVGEIQRAVESLRMTNVNAQDAARLVELDLEALRLKQQLEAAQKAYQQALLQFSEENDQQ